jgi:hypothetical protein
MPRRVIQQVVEIAALCQMPFFVSAVICLTVVTIFVTRYSDEILLRLRLIKTTSELEHRSPQPSVRILSRVHPYPYPRDAMFHVPIPISNHVTQHDGHHVKLTISTT